MSKARVQINYGEFNRLITNSVDRAVRPVMKDILEDAKKEAKSRTHRHIADHIQETQVTRKVGAKTLRYLGSIYVLLSDAPDARAFEKGSGIHSERNPQKYVIQAKKAPALSFWWEKMDTHFIGERVNHPGVKEQPYLITALRENKAKYWRWIKEVLGGK